MSNTWEWFEKINALEAKCKICATIIKTCKKNSYLKKHLAKCAAPEELKPLHIDIRDRPTKKKSAVWEWFEKINAFEARCKTCLKVVKSSKNTSNLKKHLARYHCGTTPKVISFDEDICGLNKINVPNSRNIRKNQEIVTRRSAVWEYFERIDASQAKCIICTKVVKSCGNTSNLKSHLAKHVGATSRKTSRKDEGDAIVGLNDINRPGSPKIKNNQEKQVRKKSIVWKWFEKISLSEARCKICKRVVKSSGNTSNLKLHLKAKHPRSLAVERSNSSQEDKTGDATVGLEEMKQSSEPIQLTEMSVHGMKKVKSEMDFEPLLETVKIPRDSSGSKNLVNYSKLVVPVSMRSIYWRFFGFPATSEGDIIVRTKIVCILCRSQIAYNRNTSNLRMHLQSRHLQELQEIEANGVPKRLRHEVDIVAGKSDEASSMRFLEEGEEIISFDGNKTEETIFFAEEAPPTKKARTKREGVVVSRVDVPSLVANYIVNELVSPDIVNELGFQRLMLTIENPCSLPTKRMIIDEILPKMYKQVKWKILAELTDTNYMALTIEEWTYDANTTFASVCAHYPTESGQISSMMLKTFAIFDEVDTTDLWLSTLKSILEEWQLTNENVTGVVCPMDRPTLVAALKQLQFDPLPCLNHTIKECVRAVFSHQVVSEIFAKVRKLVVFVKTCPSLSSIYAEHQSEMDRQLILDQEAVWLSTLEMMDVALEWKDVLTKTVEDGLAYVPGGLLVSEEEWEVVREVVTVLEPLKMALMSVIEQKPFISVLRPMLYQVIEHKLSVENGESETSANIKKAVSEILNSRFNDDRVSYILDIATVIDPRFKILPHFSETEKRKIGDELFKEIKDIEVQTIEEEEELGSSRRLSNMELLLGNYKLGKPKVDLDDTALLEYQTYIAHSNIRLEVDPLEWWSKHQDKYPRLGHLARKYLCVPSVSTLPSKKTLNQMLTFHSKRSCLDIQLLDKILFLHVNAHFS